MMTSDLRLAEAQALYRSKKFAQAEERLKDFDDSHPDYGAALRLMAQAAAGRLAWREAEAAAQRSIAVNGESIDDLWIIALANRNRREFAEGAELFRRLVAESPSERQVQRAYSSLNYCLVGLQRWAEAETVLREASALMPNEASFLTELAENLSAQKRPHDAAEMARRALAIDPGQVRARSLLSVASHQATGSAPPARKHRLAPFPKRIDAFKDPREVITRSLLRGYPEGERFISPSTRFLTLGSCFATNLAVRLRQSDLEVFSEFIGEEVNSTFANRYFLEWVEHGVRSGPTGLMEDAYGPELRTRYLQAIRDCDVFVFTLGVAPCFFHAETGEFYFVNATAVSQSYLLENFVMRTTTVAENVANVRFIIDTVRRLCHKPPTVVLTVSPVPLAATAEMQSAVIADCLSKSTLRLACEEVRAGDDSGQLHYWPSFEIVRWLAPYFAHPLPPAFGDMDGKSRHVSNWLVDLIMDLFIETYSAEGFQSATARATGLA